MAALLNDLRFFIGAFFLIVSIILLAEGWINPSMTEGVNLNLLTGACFLIFALVALTVAISDRKSERTF